MLMQCDGIGSDSKSIHISDLALALFASLCYLLDYICIFLVPVFAWCFVAYFYYSLFLRGRIEPYLFTILVYPAFAQIMLPIGEFGKTIAIILLVYFPLIIYFFKINRFENSFLKYKYLSIFLLFSLIQGTVLGTMNGYILKQRYFSLLIFLYITSIYHKSIDWRILLTYFRIIFTASILVYILPNYLDRTQWLLCDFGIWGEPQDKLDIISNGWIRNNGFYFDCRIFGLFAVLYFTIALLLKEKHRLFDLSISLFAVLTTLSRGSILLLLFVIAGYLIQNYKNKRVFYLLFISPLLLLMFLFLSYAIGFNEVWKTFLISGDNGALTQRSMFIIYSLNNFISNPLFGIGAGAQKGLEMFAWGYGDKESYITDAFLSSTLAEVGIVGFVLFFLFQKQIYYRKNICSIFLLIGLFAQMLGTDVPDIGIQYFVVIYLFNSLMQERYP